MSVRSHLSMCPQQAVCRPWRVLTCVNRRQRGGRLPAVAADLKHLQPAAHNGWCTILGRIHAGECSSAAVVAKIKTFPRCCRRQLMTKSRCGQRASIAPRNAYLFPTETIHNRNVLRVDPFGTLVNWIIVWSGNCRKERTITV